MKRSLLASASVALIAAAPCPYPNVNAMTCGSSSAGGITLAAITAPVSGAAPSGATQITATVNVITSCPSGSAGQIVASTNQTQIVYNKAGASCTIYPLAGSAFGSLSTNSPITIDAGMTMRADGLSATATFPTIMTNYTWNDPSVTVSIPAIAANSCSFINVTEPKARVGDRVMITDTQGSLVNSTITVSAIVNTATAGQVVEKVCNVATLTTSAATSPTISIMGFGSI